jgi:hypothetical protein
MILPYIRINSLNGGCQLGRTQGLLGRNGSMIGSEILALTKESILLALVSRLVVLEALADMAICPSLLAWHVDLLVFRMRGGRFEPHLGLAGSLAMICGGACEICKSR